MIRLNVLRAERNLPAGRRSVDVDVGGLERTLRQHIDGEVRFDEGSLAMYSTDASNYRRVPIAVVVPRTIDAVVSTFAVCSEFAAPITARGAGTGLNGQTCNTAVVVDYSKYLNRILDLDPEQRIARVQPGAICDAVSHAAEPYGLTYNAAPATHEYATFGGMIGNNSCGVHSLIPARTHRLGAREIPGGRTSDAVVEMEVLTYDGVRMRVGDMEDDERLGTSRSGRASDIFKGLRNLRDKYGDSIRKMYPAIPRRVSGYNLDDLLPENNCNVARSLVGSEGTAVGILEATVRLVPWPKFRTLVVIGYRDVFNAADHVPELLEYSPIGLEGMDDRLVGSIRQKNLHPGVIDRLPDGDGWLLVEFGADGENELRGKVEECVRGLSHGGVDTVAHHVFDDQDEADEIWDVRESGLAATAFVQGQRDAWPGWEDAALPPDRLGDYLRELRALYDEYGFTAAVYGHFGQACVHSRIDFGLHDREDVERYRTFLDDASDLVARFGGSFSAEHGDGQAKSVFLPKMFGEELMGAMRDFKRLWDPDGKMNPGRIIDPDDPSEDLRLGENYRPAPMMKRTHFQWPDDKGDFGRAALRCVGVGKCRKTEGGFMCPSFLATHEEKHTTRGRARALFEMANGNLSGGWKSEAVKESLDLCLGCKACKTDCPVNVDMAQYKSEFLSHYHEGRLQSRAAYSMGLIGHWATLASHAPGLANLLATLPGVARAGKAMAGVSQHRRVPQFAKETFTRWFRRRENAKIRRHGGTKGRVLLYPDVFNNCFHPDSLIAAVEVLEWLGYRVIIPDYDPPALRPMIHYGMLRRAKRLIEREVGRLIPAARMNAPIVCLEPSTVSVFRDELRGLFPDNDDAMTVREHLLLFSEFVDREDIEFPQMHREAILHNHCHQRAVLKDGTAQRVLQRLGIEYTQPEPSCCGMAGSFGLEADHYEISMKIAEMNLLPAVRRAQRDVLIVSEGFSCREQISERTDREPMHLSQVLRMALDRVPAESFPERKYVRDERPSLVPAAVGLTCAAALVGLAMARLASNRVR